MICPAIDRSGRPESFEENEDAPPPPPKLVRSVTKVDDEETKDLRSNKKNVVKSNLKKSKSKDEQVEIPKKPEPAEFVLTPPAVVRSRAIEKTEKYDKLVANAL